MVELGTKKRVPVELSRKQKLIRKHNAELTQQLITYIRTDKRTDNDRIKGGILIRNSLVFKPPNM